MLKHLFSSHIALGFAQAGIAAALALVILFLARRRQIHLESEIVIALVRGITQISAVGFVLLLLLKGPQWTAVIMLSIMMVAAAFISSRRVKAIPGAYEVSLYGIVTGAGIVITLMTLAGVIDWAITSLIPVGSMLIANSMNSNSLALERFRSEVTGNVGQIEAALSLGASASNTVNPYVQNAFRASLIPGARQSQVPRDCLDSGPDGRHAALRFSSDLRCDLSIRSDRDDLLGVVHHLFGEYDIGAQTRILNERPTRVAPGDRNPVSIEIVPRNEQP